MTEHPGYEKHDPDGVGTGNIRNGTRSKTVLTEASGHVEIDVPRDRASTFEPQIVMERQRRLNGVDEVVWSLHAKGQTTSEISAHFAEIYGASVTKETISRISDKAIEDMQLGPNIDSLEASLTCACERTQRSSCDLALPRRRERPNSVG